MKFLVYASIALSIAQAHAGDSCQALFEKHLESDMSLSYEEFDQTMNNGFRVLAGRGCHREAADLIEKYIEVNSAEQNSLRWHVAQLRAMSGENAEAIRYARKTLLENEDFSERPLRWNDYILATIAFLEGDGKKLSYHRDKVAEGVGEHPGNELNLRLLDALLEYSGTNYSAALETLKPE